MEMEREAAAGGEVIYVQFDAPQGVVCRGEWLRAARRCRAEAFNQTASVAATLRRCADQYELKAGVNRHADAPTGKFR